MKIEKLRKNHKKEIIIGTILVVVIGGALTYRLTHSKYRTTQSIDLATGTINYTVPDFKIMAMQQSDDGKTYSDTSSVPASEYTLNTSKSVCIVDNTKDNNITIEYSSGKINFLGITQKGTKCYLYFDKILDTEKPIITNVTTNSTKNSITVDVSANDNNGAINSGVTEYWYSINDGAYVSDTSSHTFNNLSAETSYTIKIYVKDGAGNQSDITTISVDTEIDGITIVSSGGSNYNMAYSTDGGSTWKDLPGNASSWTIPIGAKVKGFVIPYNVSVSIYFCSTSTCSKDTSAAGYLGIASATDYYTITGNEKSFYLRRLDM